MRRVPELAGRELDADPPLRRHHEPQLPGSTRPGPASGSSSASPATTRTCWGSAARWSTRRRWPRRASGVGAEVVAFLRPEGYLVTRFIEGTPIAEPRRPCAGPSRGSPTPCGGSTTGRRSPGCSSRCGSSRRTRRSPRPAASRPGRVRARPAIGRRIELALLRPARAPAVPQRLPAGQPDRRRGADPDRRLGVRGHGRPVLRPRQLQHQQRPHPGRGRGIPGRLRRRRPATRARSRG